MVEFLRLGFFNVEVRAFLPAFRQGVGQFRYPQVGVDRCDGLRDKVAALELAGVGVPLVDARPQFLEVFPVIIQRVLRYFRVATVYSDIFECAGVEDALHKFMDNFGKRCEFRLHRGEATRFGGGAVGIRDVAVVVYIIVADEVIVSGRCLCRSEGMGSAVTDIDSSAAEVVHARFCRAVVEVRLDFAL